MQKVTKTIFQIYPPLLLAMILFVEAATICINPSLYYLREMLIWLCWIPFLMLPHFFFKKRYLYSIVVVICFLLGFTTLMHWILLKGPITVSSILITLNTNFSEATEFLSLKFTFRFLWLIPYIALFICALRHPPKIDKSTGGKYIILAICAISMVFFVENGINGRFVRKATPQIVRAFASFQQEYRTFKELKKRKINQVEASISYPKDSCVTFVLIIGESASRNHFSLYDYSRNTNPKLKNREDIIVYKDVISAHSNTISTVYTMLTESNLDNWKPYHESISLADVFHSAGFKTFWLSNQLPVGVYDNAIYNMAQTFDAVHYTNYSANSTHESGYSSPYDEVLLEPISLALQDTAKHKFLIIHLMGSHVSYDKRYPKKYAIFNQGHDKKTKTIEKYDNSILYNDFVIDTIFSMLSHYAEKNPHIITSSIYLSDHGENVYDDGDNAGHNFSGAIPKANVEIPFIVWLSPQYKTHFEKKYQTIEKNKNLPFVSDNLFDAVMDLNFINYAGKDNQRSIFNEEYNAQRKRMLEDGEDYDLK